MEKWKTGIGRALSVLVVAFAIGGPVWGSFAVPKNSVVTASIAPQAVTQAKIANGAVGQAQRAALGQQISASCGNFTTSSTSAVNVTNLSVTITTTGRPVMVGLIPDVAATGFGVQISSVSSSLCGGTVYILGGASGATALANYVLQGTGNSTDKCLELVPASIYYIDVVAAGTYTYKAQASAVAGSALAITSTRIYAYEL